MDFNFETFEFNLDNFDPATNDVSIAAVDGIGASVVQVDSVPVVIANINDAGADPVISIEDVPVVAGPSEPSIKILANDVIRPPLLADHSILRSCLETGARNYNELAEGIQTEVDDGEFTSMSSQINNTIEELGSNQQPTENKTENSTKQPSEYPKEETHRPQGKFSHNASADADADKEEHLSPIINRKRKISRQGGRCIKRLFENSSSSSTSSSSSSSTPSSSSTSLSASASTSISPTPSQSTFSQPHQKEVVAQMKNIVGEVREKVEEYKARVRDSGRLRRLAEEKLKEEEDHQKENKNKYKQLLEELKRIKSQIKEVQEDSARRKTKLETLKQEAQAAVEADILEKNKLKKYNKKLAELREIFNFQS